MSHRKSHEKKPWAKNISYNDALSPTIIHWPGVADRKVQFSDLLLQGAEMTGVPATAPKDRHAPHGLIPANGWHRKGIREGPSRETRNWLNGRHGLQVFLLAWLHLSWNSASTWNSFYSSLLFFSLPPQVSDLCQSLKALSSPAPSCNNYFIKIIPFRLLLLSESKKDTTALSRSYPAESCLGRNRREKDKG